MNKIKSLTIALLVSTFPIASYSQVPSSAEPQQIEKRFGTEPQRTFSALQLKLRLRKMQRVKIKHKYLN